LRDTGPDCPLATHEAELGTVAGTGTPDLVSNGENAAEITCTVQASGSAFTVSATLDEAANVRISTVLSADNTADAPADGSVTYASTNTGGNVYSTAATPCKFWIDTDAKQFVRAGEAWFTFSCDDIENQGHVCGLDDSYVALRNCTGAEPAD